MPPSKRYRGRNGKPDNEELPGVHNPHEVRWLRLPGESWQAYEAFAIYRDMGGIRNHAKTAEKLNKSIALMSKWSMRWDWVDRAASFDANEAFERMVRMKEARLRLHENDARIARTLKNKVIQRLNSLNPDELSITQMLQAFKLGHEVEISSLGKGDADRDTDGPPVDQELMAFEKWLQENPELADAAADFLDQQE
ncbi:MAG TPA: hypothetical protein VEP28_09605 [Rubrobacter sp.]|nr:hypothetical protein [Rubrobacter sp.]